MLCKTPTGRDLRMTQDKDMPDVVYATPDDVDSGVYKEKYSEGWYKYHRAIISKEEAQEALDYLNGHIKNTEEDHLLGAEKTITRMLEQAAR